jgi:aromatic ring-opening dioxygenase catalytic subunit (LigB family)
MITMANAARQPTYFLSHGGGPWPYMDGPMRAGYAKLEQSLKDLLIDASTLPRAVLMVTAHWEAKDFTLSSNPNPPMIYDFGGFPEHTYHVHYRAPGSPDLAAQVARMLQDGGMACHLDDARGFDHGTYCVMEPARPQADIPVVQMSIKADYDPRSHIAAGQLLSPLRDDGVLIIGSGLSYHNLRDFGPGAAVPSRAFDGWLNDILVGETGAQRADDLCHWDRAPAARQAHPREDHLLPMMVAVGAAIDDPAIRIYHEDDFFGGIAVSSFRFG